MRARRVRESRSVAVHGLTRAGKKLRVSLDWTRPLVKDARKDIPAPR